MAVDSVETADYYKDKNTKLLGSLSRVSGDDYSIRLREYAAPFALSTPPVRVNPLMEFVKRELQRMEDLQVIRRVDTPSNWGAGMVVVVVVVTSVVTSIVEGDERRHIRCDLTKHKESVTRDKQMNTYDP